MRLLLLGGGHAHLAAVPGLAKGLPPGVELSLVAPSPRLLYSGMMPGWLAGRHPFADCAIDLAAVCAAHGVRWQTDRITDIDFERREAIGERMRHPFDLVSVNVGSAAPAARDAPLGLSGSSLSGLSGTPPVLGVKPFEAFVACWETWWRARAAMPSPANVLVVGGGAAAVEVALALVARARAAPVGMRVCLAASGARLLPGLSPWAARLALRTLRARGVDVRLGLRYTGVTAGGACFIGETDIAADLVLLATGARAPAWLAGAARRDAVAWAADDGLAVGADLRSISHPFVFAAGDCASIVDRPVPRSGVHALRQGSVLAANLLVAAASASEPAPKAVIGSVAAAPATHPPKPLRKPLPKLPQRYRPRPWTLALLDCGDASAIGAWGPFGWSGAWVARWKDRIDRRFIARFPSPSGPAGRGVFVGASRSPSGAGHTEEPPDEG